MTSMELSPSAALAATLRAATLAGDLYPGQRLVEKDLALRYATSRGAVREALLVLEIEGLVERQTNRGAHIRLVSLEEAVEMTEVREVLEGLCAAKAAAVIGDVQREELRTLGEAIRASVENVDVMEYCALTQELHAMITEISGQPTAGRALDRLRYQSVRHRFRVALLSGRLVEGLREHLAVIESICTGTPEEAEKAMRDHIVCVKEALLRAPSVGM